MTRQLLLERKSLRVIAKEVKRSHTWVAMFAARNGIPRNPVCQLDNQKQRHIKQQLDQGRTLNEIAKRCHVSKSTVHQYARKMLHRPGEIAFYRTRSARVCSVHGAVNVWPCVACSAINMTSTLIVGNKIPTRYTGDRNRCG